MKIKLDCQEVSRLISAAQEAGLPSAQSARLRLHFLACETCRNVEEQMAFLRRAMRELGKDRQQPK